MKISLRKANALQQLIQQESAERLVTDATLGRFDNVVSVLEEASLKLTATLDRRMDLTRVLFSIREKVAQVGASVGVAALLTRLAQNEVESRILREVAGVTRFAADKEQTIAALEQLKAETQAPSAYARTVSYTVGLISKETAEGYKKALVALRKEKQALSDKLLHLNVSSEIELSQLEVDILKKYDII